MGGTKAGSRPLNANTALTLAILDDNVAKVPTTVNQSTARHKLRVLCATARSLVFGACLNEYNPTIGIRNCTVKYTSLRQPSLTRKGYIDNEIVYQ